MECLRSCHDRPCPSDCWCCIGNTNSWFGCIAEGINDMVYATMAGLTGTFSWKDWAIQKAISVAISIVTGGIGILAAPAKVAAKVGSAT